MSSKQQPSGQLSKTKKSVPVLSLHQQESGHQAVFTGIILKGPHKIAKKFVKSAILGGYRLYVKLLT
jgi:hypothetical protein